MDQETFRTLAEVIAHECKNDEARLQEFHDIFYGDYANRSTSFVNLDSLRGCKSIDVCAMGRLSKGYVMSYTWEAESDQHRYGSFYAGNAQRYVTVKLELKTVL